MGNQEIGWFITPATDFYLTQVSVRFGSCDVTCPPFGQVGVQDFSGSPIAGGTLAAESSFVPCANCNVAAQIDFLPLHSASSYFIGFTTIYGLPPFVPDPLTKGSDAFDVIGDYLHTPFIRAAGFGS